MNQAQALQSLALVRAEALNQLATLEREHTASVAQRMPQDQRTALKSRIATLSERERELRSLEDRIPSGSQLIRDEAVILREVSEARANSAWVVEVKAALDSIAERLSLEKVKLTESVDGAIARIQREIYDLEASVSSRQTARQKALTQSATLRERLSEVRELEARSSEIQERKRQLDAAYAEAERRRGLVRSLSHIAEAARQSIVAQVFNNSLNALWRDLFLRLAPSEPFVPAFKIPEDRGSPIVARLETVHEAGGTGGAPGAMLSAGNLNTAALTLFLALHLSVQSRLPWLVLDDPVQSMDEVHIAQFAALLRTLSKQHGRQIVMTVHERPLFHYLILELSPAFPGDSLISIELSRRSSSATVAEPTFHVWEPDRALAAA